MKVIVSAGGTGGHIYPALAIINKLKEKEKNVEILYIGTTDRMEATIVPNLNIPYVGLEIKGLNRRKPWKNVSVLKSFNRAIKKAKAVMKEFKPDVVLGIGGYVTAPVILAAHSLKIKTFIHEQNSIPGLSNKLLNRYADVIGVSLEDSLKFFDKKKVTFTGNPRSEEVIHEKPVLKSKYDLTEEKKLVLIVMGSLGSLTVNEKMRNILPMFNDKNYEVLLVSGKNYYEDYKKVKVPDNVKVVSYLDDMLAVMKKTDLIVTRAGASTIAEITAIGLPAIFIPSPYVTHNHQEKNALVLQNNQAASIILEKDLTEEKLLEEIDKVLFDAKLYDIMKKNSKKMGVTDSATRIYKIIKKLANGD